MSFAIVCVMFIVHTMPRHWVYLKMGLPDAYACLPIRIGRSHPKITEVEAERYLAEDLRTSIAATPH